MMKHRITIQEDLFESSRSLELRRQIQELDRLIAREMKKKQFEKAKELTQKQESLIQELVIIGDKK